MRNRLIQPLQKSVINPVVKVAWKLGLPPPETRSLRRSDVGQDNPDVRLSAMDKTRRRFGLSRRMDADQTTCVQSGPVNLTNRRARDGRHLKCCKHTSRG